MSVYNGARYLRESLDSILSQTFPDFEFLIINDGSTDESVSILEEYALRDKRIRILHQENRGLTHSLNRGLREASGTWIARQDADDVSSPDRLEMLFSSRDGLDFLVTEHDHYSESQRVPILWRVFRFFPSKWIISLLPFVNPFAHGTFFFRKDAVLALGGYDEGFERAQDYELLLRSRTRLRLRFLRRPLYQLRLHASSVSVRSRKSQFFYALLASLRSASDCASSPSATLDLVKETRALSLKYPVRAFLFLTFYLVRSKKLEFISWLREK